MTYTLIAHQELTSSQASITFSSIPQTFTDLLLVISPREAGSSFSATNLFLTLNGSTANFSARHLFGTGSGVVTNTADRVLATVNGGTSTANTFGSVSVYFPNYRSNLAKSFSSDGVSENNSTEAYQRISAHLWNNTAAISSIALNMGNDNFVSGSSATLYGITAGTTPGVVVS
jgi:hypothetical protein